MILPIYIYPEQTLREPAEDVAENSEEVQKLIDDMVDTMHGAAGIGLAAPQVNRPKRIFVIDLSGMADDLADEGEDVPREPIAFINPEIIEESDTVVEYEEGCLSIPDIRELVQRPETIRLRYLDREFKPQEITASGMFARVLQHEYDHLEGILFVDLLSAFKRRMLRRRLREMSKGQFEAEYPVVQNPR